jgi:hypothetical protein
MDIAIQIFWWVGLIGALIPTLVILKEVALIIKTLKEIHSLAILTGQAAKGISQNLEAVSALPGFTEQVSALRDSTNRLRLVTSSIEDKLRTIAVGTPSSGD